MLIPTQRLTPQQNIELEHLSALCQPTDKYVIPLYQHLLSQHHSLPRTLLYYENQQLVGYLSAFFFYEDACEISVMIAPAYRKRGLATYLLKKILPLLYSQHSKRVIFSVPSELNNQRLLTKGFCYQSSEYQMQRLNNDTIPLSNNMLSIRLATREDLSALCSIDNACFPAPQNNMVQRYQDLFYDSDYKLFIAQKEGQLIGKVHLFWHEDSIHFTDIAILPHYQKQGYGREMLTHCINYCINEKSSIIKLDVEITNKNALNLYLHLGFFINNAYDFWTNSIENFQKNLLS